MKSTTLHRKSAIAFTLIELLVVVTIIVVLLALLTPALDRAIYSAELTVCESHLHAVGQVVSVYASGNRRYYPYRPGIYWGWTYRDSNLAMGPAFGGEASDDRPLFKTIMPINATLNCPLNKWIDLEASNAATECSYQLWFGTQFGSTSGHPQPGMFKLGDRLSWTYNGATSLFGVLASDIDDTNDSGKWTFGTHPETADPVMGQYWVFNDDTGVGAGLFSISRWDSNYGTKSPDRGPIDRNFSFADGSVSRITHITYQDIHQENRDLGKLPIFMTGQQFDQNQFTTLPLR